MSCKKIVFCLSFKVMQPQQSSSNASNLTTNNMNTLFWKKMPIFACRKPSIHTENKGTAIATTRSIRPRSLNKLNRQLISSMFRGVFNKWRLTTQCLSEELQIRMRRKKVSKEGIEMGRKVIAIIMKLIREASKRRRRRKQS